MDNRQKKSSHVLKRLNFSLINSFFLGWYSLFNINTLKKNIFDKNCNRDKNWAGLGSKNKLKKQTNKKYTKFEFFNIFFILPHKITIDKCFLYTKLLLLLCVKVPCRVLASYYYEWASILFVIMDTCTWMTWSIVLLMVSLNSTDHQVALMHQEMQQ